RRPGAACPGASCGPDAAAAAGNEPPAARLDRMALLRAARRLPDRLHDYRSLRRQTRVPLDSGVCRTSTRGVPISGTLRPCPGQYQLLSEFPRPLSMATITIRNQIPPSVATKNPTIPLPSLINPAR